VVTTRTVEPTARERDTVVSPLAAGNSRSFPSTVEFEAQDDEPQVIERAEMVKVCEFENGQFVLFTADELKSLEAQSRQTIDIVSFIPEPSVDPIYFDKA